MECMEFEMDVPGSSPEKRRRLKEPTWSEAAHTVNDLQIFIFDLLTIWALLSCMLSVS